MVGNAARWTRKKKNTVFVADMFSICVALTSAHLRRKRQIYQILVGQAFVNVKILSYCKDDILMHFIRILSEHITEF